MTDPFGLEFVYTPRFLASARDLLDEVALRQLESRLVADPRAGDIVPGTGGVRKLRTALPGRGKRGGGRVIYLYVEVRETVYLLLAYAKSERLDLSQTEKHDLKALAKQLEEEPWR